MNTYGIKRGHYANIEGDQLKALMKDIFGNVKKDGDKLVSTYGALDPLVVCLDGKKTITVETTMNPKVDNDVASETIAKYNDFLLRATGFTSKERKKKANKA
ncbi:MAG: DUF5611 family protein [Thermoplasmata archaeon]|nr:DUF5611 family protein [Thermoplasmata archaeon]